VKIPHRKAMMASLLLAFAGQSALVYADDTADAQPRLDELALEGRRIWLDNNCQVCHQLYGFGGFLGPDLTNVAARIDRTRLETMLTVGSGQMPAWGFDEQQIDAVEAFLRALNGTGIGQARRTVPMSPAHIATAMAAETAKEPLSASALAGQQRFQTMCAVCHCLFTATPLGPFLAPDLSGVRNRLSEAELHQVITNGRPARGMPPWPLTAGQRGELLDYLGWLARHREAVLATGRATADTENDGLPWFEYR
jgi:nitric oxide reductase subunit C